MLQSEQQLQSLLVQSALAKGPLCVVLLSIWLHTTYTFFLGFTEDEECMSRVAGSSIFTFQKVKRGHSMAQTGESLHSTLAIRTQQSFITSAAFIRRLLKFVSYEYSK